MWAACLFATLLELPIAAAYVWMATAMPRSGGDYVFQSRVLGGTVGFPIVMSGFVIWILLWVALAGWLLAQLGVTPLLLGLGVHYNSTGLINAGVWAEGHAGTVTISIIGAALMAVLLVTGFKNYVRLQYFMFAGTGILVVIMLVQFLRTSPAQFAVAMNHFSALVNKNPTYYTWLQHDVSATGFNIAPKFALGATLLAAPIAWTSTQWATYSVEQGGEIKGARVFKNQFFIIVGSLISVGIVLALIAATEQHAVGTKFFNAVSASGYGFVSKSGLGIGKVIPSRVRWRSSSRPTRSSPSWSASASCWPRCRSSVTVTSGSRASWSACRSTAHCRRGSPRSTRASAPPSTPTSSTSSWAPG